MKFILSHICCLLIYTCIRGRRIRREDDGHLPYAVYLEKQVSLYRVYHFCGGTILTPTIILTAARCVCNNTGKEIPELRANMRVLVLRGDRKDSYLVESIICHNKYKDDGNYKNDIALLELEEPIKYTRNVYPVKLPISVEEKKLLMLSRREDGYDVFEFRNINLETCAVDYGRVITESNVCAIPQGLDFRRACFAEPGAALVDEEGIQHGFYLSVKDCDSRKPAVFTSVYHYLSWINNNGFSALRRKVFKGVQAKDGQFPYQVSLQTERREHFCGGSILNSTTILTAAHCVCNDSIILKNIIVLAGTNNPLANGQSSNVEKKVCHDEYSPYIPTNDIALLKLKTPLNYTKTVRPITLPTSEVADNGKLNFTGWGNTDFHNKDYKYYLQSIELGIVNWRKCAEMLRRYESEILDSVCAKSRGEGRGACYGDAGGPLADEDYIQYGIASYAIPGCYLGEPATFASVFHHKNWILWNRP